MRRTWLVLLVVGGGCQANELGRLAAEEFGDVSNGAAPRAAWDGGLVAACGEARVTAAGDEVLVRQPYLQRVTDADALVMWTTVDARPQAVRVALPGGEAIAEVTANTEPTTALRAAEQRMAHLADLAPDTTYCYDVVDATGARLLGPVGFRTAPAPGDPGDIRFVTMGDLGKRSIDQYAVLDQLRAVEMDFVLVNGDVAYDDGTLGEFESHFFDVYADLTRSVPFFIASGNHDYRTADGAVLREVFALFENGGADGRERWYSYDWGPAHFAVLDTEGDLAAQVAWLDADLAASTAAWNIVTMHRPPYSSGVHGSDTTVRDAFAPVLRRHRVPLVFAGHDHDYERTVAVDGTHYVVAGAGGRGTRPVGDSRFTAFSEQVSHFVYVAVDDTTLTLWAVDATGATFDSLRLDR